MKPTMKLRWRRANHGDDCVPFGEQWRNGFSDEWGMLTGYVLQQWWYEPCPEVEPENCDGEWRDIPVERNE